MPLRADVLAFAAALLAVAGTGHAQDLPAPPADAPQGQGPRGTSQAGPGAQRFDVIGYAMIDAKIGNGVAVALPGLAEGSFAELTSIDTGKTIAAQAVAAPALPSGYVAVLSGAAASALGAGGPSVALRVRQVEPTQQDQAALRSGRAASERLDAPKILLTALRKRLPASPSAGEQPPAPARTVVPTSSQKPPARKPVPAPVKRAPGASYAPPVANTPTAPVPVVAPPPAAALPSPAVRGRYFVQLAALSDPRRANAVASSMGGSVVAGGGLFRIRLGPFADLRAAEQARARAKGRGFGDAAIIDMR